jgi:hypothetical protein
MLSSPFFRVKGTDEFCQPTGGFCHYGSVRPQYTVCQFLGTTISGIQNEAHNLQILPCSVCPLEDNNIKVSSVRNQL